jgi:TRAP-type C4-dicarboxylate transport system permease small subunit
MDDAPGWGRRLLDGLYTGGGVLSGVFLVVILGLMMGLSLGRPLGFDIPSGDDFAAWSLAAMSFLGLAHTFKKGEMIRVGLLLERLKGRAKQAAEVFSLCVGIIFIGYFLFNVIRLAYDSWRFFDMSTGVVVVPLWIPQSALGLGLGLLWLALIDELAIVLQGRRPTYEKEPPATTEELLDRVASGGGV